MSHGNRCLMVHGHFYQPPRENPWTGAIDPQASAQPWENWNSRIAEECYLPMARSRVHTRHGEVADLYNNYAHASFNFGPTLLSWLADHQPRLIDHIRDATVFNRTCAMAQAYNHMMLPLADSRDRHTQILWGLREFQYRFGYYPRGMWLPECGIDPETVRALVDHRVEYVILSPHQASKARPFGESGWREASMGGIDTRRAYRLFETDGGGRTHFDRHLDIIFYTPGLNLKVSFDHILNRPDDLRRELENCYLPDYDGAQLVSIVTDGEIYGHHEKSGEEALTRLFREIAPDLGLRVVSAGEFVRDHPPTWEVKLWAGEDGAGSSWSCQHGMGRWSRDCGCTSPTPEGWNQAWRQPLRDALDGVRDAVRETARRELGGLLLDADEARDDYITVVLDPSPASRAAFIRRHAQRELDVAEVEKLWRLLEAGHNAMLMYTSCGWFFDELSGLEPVQNMRYALRALELAGPWCGDEARERFEAALARAPSNLPRFGDGGAVFRDLVAPSRHDDRALAAALALCLAANLPVDGIGWELVGQCPAVHFSDARHVRLAWGSFVCRDPRLDRFISTAWVARLDDLDNIGVGLHGFRVAQGDPGRDGGGGIPEADRDFAWLDQFREMDLPALIEWFESNGFTLARLPEDVRGKLYRVFTGGREDELLQEVAELGALTLPFLSRARRYGVDAPEALVAAVASAFEREIDKAVLAAVTEMAFSAARLEEVERARRSAEEMWIQPNLATSGFVLEHISLEFLYWLSRVAEPGWLESLAPITLPDGSEWLAPRAPANHQYAFPSGRGLALAGGKSLAALRHRLLRESGPEAALTVIPLPEALEFARRAGLDCGGIPALGIAYWEFLDTALPALIAADPAGLMAGPAGDRVRAVGRELGFAEETVAKRILAATRKGM